jgi:threonine synthase
VRVSHLTCFACGAGHDADKLFGLCDCGKPLRVDYALTSQPRPTAVPSNFAEFAGVLPLEPDFRTLGEGGTPLLPASFIGPNAWIKDEGLNPTGSFKARGMAMAVYMAWKLGAKKLAVPSAGNAGGALAAYAALYGLEAHVFMPKDVPAANRLECELYGAKVTLVDGLITDCARLVIEGKEREGWFDVSTLKEPYRIEGKKTMGYEIVAQLGWRYPDAILYPTGGGTGLIGMWKAFEEMEALGWVSGKRPRMYSVQAEGCRPIVNLWGTRTPSPFSQSEKGEGAGGEGSGAPHTIAAGLRVPKALGDFIILDILQRSGGGAIAVSDEELLAGARAISARTGICACPEGGACLPALEALRRSGEIGPEETVVLFNTGTGVKYAEAFGAKPC